MVICGSNSQTSHQTTVIFLVPTKPNLPIKNNLRIKGASWIYNLLIFSSRPHHHHVTLSARISLTLSRHPSISSIASGRSSGLHPVSAPSCCMYVRAGRPAFARPCEGVHRSTSLMSWSLLLQQCPVCLVRLIFIFFVMGGKWPYGCFFVGCCLQDLFNIARNILV